MSDAFENTMNANLKDGVFRKPLVGQPDSFDVGWRAGMTTALQLYGLPSIKADRLASALEEVAKDGLALHYIFSKGLWTKVGSEGNTLLSDGLKEAARAIREKKEEG